MSLDHRSTGGASDEAARRSVASPELAGTLRARELAKPGERERQDRTRRLDQVFPTPLMRSTEAAADYPVDALGPLLGPAARAIAAKVGVPMAISGNSVLAAAALAAQARADVETVHGGSCPLSLYVLTIAESGDRKTSCDRIALQPVEEHRKALTKAYRRARSEHEAQVEALKLERQKAREAAQSGDELAAKLRGLQEAVPPRAPKFLCKEPTAPALMCSLTDGQYSQGIFSDEAGKLLGGHAFSDDASMHTAGFLNDAWQGTPLDRVRAADREFTVLYGRRLSIHLMAQPKVSKKFVGNDLHRDQGLLARWLIAAPQSIAGKRLEINRTSPADIPEVRAYSSALTRLLELPVLEDHEVGGLSPPLLRLTPEAFELLKAACLEWERAQAPGCPLEAVKEWASKAAEQACRIAGVLTVVENPDQPCVHAETMRRAVQLAQFYLSEYQRVIGTSAPPPHLDRAQAVIDWLRRAQRNEVTAREIMREGPKAVRTSDAARTVLRALVRDGWLTTRDGKVYQVNLYLHTTGSS